MVCMYCGGATQVINSRPQKRLNRIWRRRECLDCHRVITSIEDIDLTTALRVATPKNLVEFDRDQLLLSVHASLGHRSDARLAASALTNTIIATLLKANRTGQISTQEIRDTATEILQRFDSAAAVHYQAYHP